MNQGYRIPSLLIAESLFFAGDVYVIISLLSIDKREIVDLCPNNGITLDLKLTIPYFISSLNKYYEYFCISVVPRIDQVPSWILGNSPVSCCWQTFTDRQALLNALVIKLFREVFLGPEWQLPVLLLLFRTVQCLNSVI